MDVTALAKAQKQESPGELRKLQVRASGCSTGHRRENKKLVWKDMLWPVLNIKWMWREM